MWSNGKPEEVKYWVVWLLSAVERADMWPTALVNAWRLTHLGPSLSY